MDASGIVIPDADTPQHLNPDRNSGRKNLQVNVKRDRKNMALLKEEVWNPIVVWECELKNGADEVLEKISANLSQQYAMVNGA